MFVGIALGTVSALLFSSTNAALSRQLIKIDPRVVNYVSSLIGMLVLLVSTVASSQISPLILTTLPVFLIFFSVGITQFGLGRLLSYVAVKNIGANLSTTILPTQVLYSFLFAVLFLNERLAPLNLIGGVLVAVGPILTELGKGARIRSGNAKVGFMSAALSGLIFGITAIAISAGLSKFPYYLPATLLAYVAAVFFNSVLSNPVKIFRSFKQLKKSAMLLIAFAGVFTSLAQLSRFAAFHFAPVVLVVPFIALYPTFTLIMTAAFLRDVETFSFRTIIGIVAVTLGAVLVAFAR